MTNINGKTGKHAHTNTQKIQTKTHTDTQTKETKTARNNTTQRMNGRIIANELIKDNE